MGAVFTCSIDDGHPSDIRLAELLSKHGLPGTFYIPIRNSEGYEVMAHSHIREIGRQFEIGSHTFSHCFLNKTDLPIAHREITEGKIQLEDMIGKEVAGFCYPGGKYRQEHIDMVQSAGFRYARTSMNLCFYIGEHPFEMPTTIQFYPHSRSIYLRNFAHGGNWKRRRHGLRLAVQHKDWVNRVHALFEYARQGGKLFHLWVHSRDLDELDAWKKFDHFLAHAATGVAPHDRLTNGQMAARYY